jgi:hypothetical protein
MMTTSKSQKGKSGRRSLHEVEKYSKLYYKERVQSTVLEDLAPFGSKPPRSIVLDTIKRVTKEIYEIEDDETKAIVKAALAADLVATAAAAEEDKENEDVDSLTPTQMQE